mmetsp:Transcript_13376/g.20905  ORF Transcript_13376/g.20905 Transcript_13376/m.20905 type:complete len:120 (+) Transcript_13376:3037-3396(+)
MQHYSSSKELEALEGDRRESQPGSLVDNGKTQTQSSHKGSSLKSADIFKSGEMFKFSKVTHESGNSIDKSDGLPEQGVGEFVPSYPPPITKNFILESKQLFQQWWEHKQVFEELVRKEE